MRIIFTLSAYLGILISAEITYAQNTTTNLRPSDRVFDRSYYANPRFDQLVREAMVSMPQNFRFGRLRDYYYQTRQYDPIGDDIVENLQTLAFTIQNASNIDTQNIALNEYRALIKAHMGNIRVVTQALALSHTDQRLGNPKFFTWMRDGLLRQVLQSGDGKTLAGAYRVTNMSEETILIGQLGVKVLNTITANEGRIFYNMHDVYDLRTGQKRTLFVDTTIPIRFLNAQHSQKGQRLDITRQ